MSEEINDYKKLCRIYHAIECKVRMRSPLNLEEEDCYYHCKGKNVKCPDYESYEDHIKRREYYINIEDKLKRIYDNQGKEGC